MNNCMEADGKQAVIDIGSNSIRLTLYHIKEQDFKILFREKIMAGLAGYVENGELTADGIACACDALLEFRQTLEALRIAHAAVFATASLRNIANTQEALQQIREATGFEVEVLTGEQEALMGYTGAMRELEISGGAFVDVGGASTEIVTFEDGKIIESASFGVGSLNLYRTCVKKILPGPGSLRRIDMAIRQEMEGKNQLPHRKRTPLICVGGSARAVLKLAVKCCHLPESTRCITARQVEQLCLTLCQADRQAADLILRAEPGRIHTLVPGLMILRYIMNYFDSDELIVSRYGVREGYLCQKIISR